jgi:hypothetical protein
VEQFDIHGTFPRLWLGIHKLTEVSRFCVDELGSAQALLKEWLAIESHARDGVCASIVLKRIDTLRVGVLMSLHTGLERQRFSGGHSRPQTGKECALGLFVGLVKRGGYPVGYSANFTCIAAWVRATSHPEPGYAVESSVLAHIHVVLDHFIPHFNGGLIQTCSPFKVCDF